MRSCIRFVARQSLEATASGVTVPWGDSRVNVLVATPILAAPESVAGLPVARATAPMLRLFVTLRAGVVACREWTPLIGNFRDRRLCAHARPQASRVGLLTDGDAVWVARGPLATEVDSFVTQHRPAVRLRR